MLAFSVLCSPAVCCYMFISGYFEMKFRWGRLFYFIFLSFCCLFIGLLIRWYVWGDCNKMDIVRHLFPISTQKWWFLTFYVMIYILSPLINKGLSLVQKNELKTIIYLCFSVLTLSFFQFSSGSGSTLFMMLSMYLLGRYFRMYDIRLSLKNSALVFCAAFLILFVIVVGLNSIPGPNSHLAFIALCYNNPLIIMMAVTLFFVVLNLRPSYNQYINKLLAPILSIYLLTETTGKFFYEYQKNLFDNGFLLGFLSIILVSISCLLIGHLVNCLFELLKKICVKETCQITNK